MKGPLRIAFGALGLLSLVSLNLQAQVDTPGPAAYAGAPTALLSTAQLDQLTAPIALYPDPLVGQILTAATYPLEIVEAHRWLQDPANAALRGGALTAALQEKSWDLSVKSLVAFPQVLEEMDRDLEWSEQLGDAFLAQQGAVMDSIQRLRHRAATAGSLSSTPQQTVTTNDQDIEIQPAEPGLVYVPYYDPNVIYGPWPWPDLPPMFFLAPPGMVLMGGLWIGFGVGFPILGPFWGWGYWDWPHHYFGWTPGRGPGHNGPWLHNPVHRRGVPYRDNGVAARFQGQSEAARRDVRGYPAPTEGQRGPASRPTVPIAPREAPTRSVTPSYRPAPPAFESYGGGAQVRQEAARGAGSRSAPVSAPSGGGGSRGGGGGGGRGGRDR
ncbi:MAG: DUF3300 domain-containing protein [Steroidobacteraceae bacterium]